MSKFHESVRQLLEDIYSFLRITLHQELLSTNAIASKEGLLLKLQSINQQYPQLQLVLPDSLSEVTISSNHEASSSSPTSPPPYIDMHGNSAIMSDSELKKTPEESYEPCSSEKSCDIDMQTKSESDYNLSGDGQISGVELSLPAMSATHVAKFEKCGFLEKKRKERLGGLIKSSQQRWYGINGGIMYYYDKPTDKMQKGAIILPGYEVRPVLGKDKKNSFSFELVCPGRRTYQFSALTENDMKQWFSAIERNTKGDATALLASISPSRSSECKTQICATESDGIYEMVEEKEGELSVEYSDQSNIEVKENGCISDTKNTTSSIDYQNLYIGLWDCESEDGTELDFSRGDVIHVLSKEYDSYAWWIGELHGKIGFVPKSYLMEAYRSF